MKVELVSDILKKTGQIRFFLLIAFLGGFIIDAFFIKPENTYTDWFSDVRLFSLLLVWLFVSKLFSFGGTETLKFSFIILIFLSFFFIFAQDIVIRERLASWLYVFLATGILQQVFEAKEK